MCRTKCSSVTFALTLGCALWAIPCFADVVGKVREGNEAYRKQDYNKAVELYRQAETELPTSPELAYNLGNGLYARGEYEGAVEQYTRALGSTDPRQLARTHYNLGSTHFSMQDYQKAISAFEETLKLDPSDQDAKFNLELSRKMLKEQIQPQGGGNSDQDQKQQQNQNQQNQDQQQQDQQESEKEEQSQNKSQPDKGSGSSDATPADQKKEEEKQQGAQEQRKMSKQDAERILNALKNDEQKAQDKLKRTLGTADYVGKDW